MGRAGEGEDSLSPSKRETSVVHHGVGDAMLSNDDGSEEGKMLYLVASGSLMNNSVRRPQTDTSLHDSA